MQTYTFDTIIQDGMIPIPEKYRGITTGEVRVTIQKEESAQPRRKRTYNAGKLNISGFKFSREEANARK